MRIATLAILLLPISSACATQRRAQSTSEAGASQRAVAFATNQYVSKGGIGIVNTHLYIVVESGPRDLNELIVKPTEHTEQRWHGKRVGEPELVVFSDAKIWSSGELPEGFDLAGAVVISFERDKIRFFDFGEMSGGYYARIATTESESEWYLYFFSHPYQSIALIGIFLATASALLVLFKRRSEKSNRRNGSSNRDPHHPGVQSSSSR